MLEQTINTHLPLAPGPKGLPIIGNVLEAGNDLLAYYREVWTKYGDVSQFRLGPIRLHLIVRPEHVKRVLMDNRENYLKGIAFEKVKLLLGNGLFTSEGSLWARQRKLMQPLFTPKNVTPFVGPMVDAANQVVQSLEQSVTTQQPVDISYEMLRFAVSVISRTMFGTDLAEDSRQAGQALRYALTYISEKSLAIIDIPRWVPTPSNVRFRKSIQILDNLVYRIVEQRRGNVEGPQDLLSRLMNATDETTGQRMDDLQIRNEVMTIFLAGHETTALALTWTWYLLALHPEARNRMLQEVDSVLAGDPVTAEKLPQLRYTRMVVEEAMRLYPPVWAIPRQATEEDEIGGYRIPAGSMVLAVPYITHRHPEFWENPEEFEPERFSEERVEKREKHAYYPFGAGPRICLGMHFALVEAVTAVATLAAKFTLDLVPGQVVVPEMAGTLRPKKSVMMTVVRR